MKWLSIALVLLGIASLTLQVVMGADITLNGEVEVSHVLSFWFTTIMFGFSVGVVIATRIRR